MKTFLLECIASIIHSDRRTQGPRLQYSARFPRCKVGTEGATKEVHGKTVKPGAKGKAAPPVKAASMASKSAASAASTLETKEEAEKAGEDKEDDESEPGSPIHND